MNCHSEVMKKSIKSAFLNKIKNLAEKVLKYQLRYALKGF
jgi:hypothetical protein